MSSPLVAEVGKRTCCRLLDGRNGRDLMGGPVHWYVGLIPIPMVEGALFLGEIRGDSVPFTDG